MLYLFIDQYPPDKVIPGLVVKIVSEELSNLKNFEKNIITTIAVSSSTASSSVWKQTCGEQILM